MATSVPVHVEVLLKSESVADYDDVRNNVVRALSTADELFSVGECSLLSFPALGEHVQRIVIAEIGAIGAGEKTPVAKENAELFVHVFKLNNEPPVDETADDDASVVTCQQLELPASALDGLWESLIYDSEVKDTLLAYATTAMLFAEAKVNPHIISWNRVVLLHGPPGTGKTSLCKALAQKLSIRLANRYPNAYLLEINAHSLFSKWFSESGKLVMKLFRQILDLVEDGEALVCVLIDEVESLTAARQAAASGSDPSDAIRVVNALLTQLDALKQHPNVLVLTTSNITGAIDLAFVDRADIKQYIGPPSSRARYEILRSCVEELQRVGIVQASGTDTFFPAALPTMAGEVNAVSRALLEVAEVAVGLSGRALRKLPFQAYALRAQAFSTAPLEFIALLAQAVHQEKQNIQDLASG